MINPKHFSDMFLRFILLAFLLRGCENCVTFGQQGERVPAFPTNGRCCCALISAGEVALRAGFPAEWGRGGQQRGRARVCSALLHPGSSAGSPGGVQAARSSAAERAVYNQSRLSQPPFSEALGFREALDL